MKQNQFEFKPFDQVLVRDADKCTWKVDIYSHYEKESAMPHVCVGSFYDQCIPYNENTAHLIGTDKPYKEPEPKVWRVINCDNNEKSWDLTDDELKRFIKIAAINNKDITTFYVNRIR